jgi:uncharacterized repeat protein (TIGR03806 family)
MSRAGIFSIHSWIAGVALTASLILAGCGGGGGDSSGTPTNTTPTTTGPTVFDVSNAPTKLSAWNMVGVQGTTLSLNGALVPYDLNSTLFSDYAFKLRAIYVPPGKTINYTTASTDTLDFPIGTVLVKTFYYPNATGTDPANYLPVAHALQTQEGTTIDLTTYHLVETRLLVRQADGTWAGLPYVWDDDQKDATLTTQGKYISMELVEPGGASSQKFTYAVPNSQTCQQCHASSTNGSGSATPIGPKSRNLNKTYDYGNGTVKNQLQNLADLKLLAGFTGVASAPVNADWKDTTQPLEQRAKAYLDVNCAHCHNGKGYASQSGLLLTFDNIGTTTATDTWGICKLPLAYVGTGLPGYKYDINPGSPGASILLYRMSHVGAGQTMPVVGRQTNHVEGISMVSDWIQSLSLPACAP